MTLQTALDLAGMGTDGTGVAGSWPVPRRADVDSGTLRWAGSAGRATADGTILGSFLALADGSDDQIATFARRYGPLLPPSDRLQTTGVQVLDSGSELVAAWRCIAGDVRRLLEVAAQLHRGQSTAPRAWADFETFAARRSGGDVTVNLGRVGRAGRAAGITDVWGQPSLPATMSERQAVGWILSTWLRATSTAVTVAWTDGPPAVAVSAPGLLSAIVVQTAQMVSLSSEMAFCRGCGVPFARRHGNRRYCDRCVDLKEPQRRATAEFRRRQRNS